MNLTFYDSFRSELLKGNINFGTDTIKLILLTSAYTPSLAHDTKSDLTNEVIGTGYTAGGKTLTNVVVAIDSVNNKASLSADDISWTNSSITARYAVLYDDTNANKPLIGYIDLERDRESLNSEFTISFDDDVILEIE